MTHDGDCVTPGLLVPGFVEYDLVFEPVRRSSLDPSHGLAISRFEKLAFLCHQEPNFERHDIFCQLAAPCGSLFFDDRVDLFELNVRCTHTSQNALSGLDGSKQRRRVDLVERYTLST